MAFCYDTHHSPRLRQLSFMRHCQENIKATENIEPHWTCCYEFSSA